MIVSYSRAIIMMVGASTISKENVIMGLYYFSDKIRSIHYEQNYVIICYDGYYSQILV